MTHSRDAVTNASTSKTFATAPVLLISATTEEGDAEIIFQISSLEWLLGELAMDFV